MRHGPSLITREDLRVIFNPALSEVMLGKIVVFQKKEKDKVTGFNILRSVLHGKKVILCWIVIGECGAFS